MIKIGTILGDRYEILEKIGSGGMADVYKAKCHKLNRYVAVKVLKQEFSENANFVSKFRIEAQAAAGLAHSNIVNVYDVGEEKGVHYIVMELVEGITLKKYIEKKARLSYKEAVSIAIQVSMGIGAAHNNHIIHRDIKPQNIIISREGRVKVTDFGIAKAASSNTITSNVMGSVHYTSPEQARGGYSDEKSDIYSLGITMFEMLTGRIPFNGDTTVAIAIKHIQEDMPSPRQFVAEIPLCVESIVLKCTQKSPDRRYQSMAELTEDLKQALLNPDADFVVLGDPNMDAGTRMAGAAELGQIKSRLGYETSSNTGALEAGMRLAPGYVPSQTAGFAPAEEVYEEEAYADEAVYEDELPYEDAENYTEEYYEEEEEEDDDDGAILFGSRTEKVTTILTVIGAIIICLILFLLAWNLLGGSFSFSLPGSSLESPIAEETEDEPTPTPLVTEEEEAQDTGLGMTTMPDVEGLSLEDGRSAIIQAGLLCNISYEESEEVDAGCIISTDIEAGTSVQMGTIVEILVSAGNSGIAVPDVTGLSYEEAYSVLTAAGFLVNKTATYSDSVAADYVVSQSPEAETKMASGSVIGVCVSLGAEDVKISVPNLIGKSETDAIVALVEAGLTVGSVDSVYNASVSSGYVCYQNYSAGTYVDKGTSVNIQVSLGEAPVTYKCNVSISAPSTSEAPDYTSGTSVTVVLTTDQGTTLLETTTSSFPISANYYGLSSSGGTITMTYTATTVTTVTDEETGEETTNSTTETKSFTRSVTFEQE